MADSNLAPQPGDSQIAISNSSESTWYFIVKPNLYLAEKEADAGQIPNAMVRLENALVHINAVDLADPAMFALAQTEYAKATAYVKSLDTMDSVEAGQAAFNAQTDRAVKAATLSPDQTAALEADNADNAAGIASAQAGGSFEAGRAVNVVARNAAVIGGDVKKGVAAGTGVFVFAALAVVAVVVFAKVA